MENNDFWGWQDTNQQMRSNFGDQNKQYVVNVDLAEVLRANTEAMIAGFKLGLYQRTAELKNKDDI